jgi:hypothetical protein
MPTLDPILAQRVADLLGRLSVMESLLPRIADTRTRTVFAGELVHIKQMINQLQN